MNKINNNNKFNKKSTKKQLRDQQRLINFLNKKNNFSEDNIKTKITEIKDKRKENRKIRFIEQKYKKIKFYEMKKLKKSLKKLEVNKNENESEIKLILEKINYINFYPKDKNYISIIKTDLKKEVEKVREEILLECQEKAKNYEFKKIKDFKEEGNINYNLEDKDNFFVNNEDDIELSENFKIKKVDKTGNIFREK